VLRSTVNVKLQQCEDLFNWFECLIRCTPWDPRFL